MSTGNDRIEIKETDMSPDMVKTVVDIVRIARQIHFLDKDVAAHVKDKIEDIYGSPWHVVVGKSFGSRVSYEANYFMLLKINNINVMIFKCGY
uniref:Dynein light chain n=1 Tax=Panagrellus redivivus TaxID=6233 RepID=A0A7E4VCC1_PANRE